ncbi:MAG: ABC transporter permease [Minisyncoccia bacterium]|jgi:ABC-type polysaccharide/polyol phosphate export permease
MKKKKLSHYLNVIYELSRLDFKLKYYGSVLGLLWSFLKPFMMLAILYVVFFYFLKVGIQNYEVYLLLGIIFWNFFADTTKDSTVGVVTKAHLLQKTNLPPFVVVTSVIVHSLWTFLITLAIFFIFFFALGLHLTWSALTLLLLVPSLIILTAGVSFLIVPLHMRFKDFGHIWDIFLQMLFWATPIVYQYTLVPEPYSRWYLLNPVARIIIDARNAVLYNFFPEAKQLLITIAITAVVFAGGWLVFRKYGRTFIDEL